MVEKSSFSPDEWRRILQAPLLAGLAVSAADPSGWLGTLRESLANARALEAFGAEGESDRLIRAVLDDLSTPEGRMAAREGVRHLIQGAEMSQIKATTLAELGAAARMLDRACPVESGGFRKWLEEVARIVAEAATEGGLLGFGGARVSDAERATLAEIRAALAGNRKQN
jgi:hypothetical protein